MTTASEKSDAFFDIKYFRKNLVVTIDITTKQYYNTVVIKKITTNRFKFPYSKLLKNYQTKFRRYFIMKIAVVCANGNHIGERLSVISK